MELEAKLIKEPMTADTCLKIARVAGHILSNKVTKEK